MDAQDAQRRLPEAIGAIHRAANTLKEQEEVFAAIDWSTFDDRQFGVVLHAVRRAANHTQALVNTLPGAR